MGGQSVQPTWVLYGTEGVVLLSIMIVNELTVFASLTVRFSSEGFVKCCALRNA